MAGWLSRTVLLGLLAVGGGAAACGNTGGTGGRDLAHATREQAFAWAVQDNVDALRNADEGWLRAEGDWTCNNLSGGAPASIVATYLYGYLRERVPNLDSHVVGNVVYQAASTICPNALDVPYGWVFHHQSGYAAPTTTTTTSATTTAPPDTIPFPLPPHPPAVVAPIEPGLGIPPCVSRDPRYRARPHDQAVWDQVIRDCENNPPRD